MLEMEHQLAVYKKRFQDLIILVQDDPQVIVSYPSAVQSYGKSS